MKKIKKILGAAIILSLLISGIQLAAQPATASEQEVLNQEQGSVIEEFTLDKLTAGADSILLGEVADIACYNESSLYNLITFQVEEAIKGEIEGEAVIKVSAEEVDAPDFHLGERVIVFLKKGEDFFTVIGGSCGKYTIQDDRVIRTGRSLVDFIAEVSELVEAQSERPELLLEQASLVLDIPVRRVLVEPEGTPLAGAWQNIMTEDFEGTFPGAWNVFADSGPDAYWGKDGYRNHTDGGSYSAFCAKEGTAGVNPPNDYPNDMDAWMIYGQFSLEGATDARLDFYLWADIELGFDYACWAASTDGFSFNGWQFSGDSGGWGDRSFDLTHVPTSPTTFIDLCGESQVWIAFIFESDVLNIGDYEGAFIDDVVLRKFVGVKEPDISLDKNHLDFELDIEAGSIGSPGPRSVSSTPDDAQSLCKACSAGADSDGYGREPQAETEVREQSRASEQAQLEAIRRAIEQKGAQWEAGVTSVSGLSLEAKKRLCGAKFAPVTEDVATVTPSLDLAVLPPTFDWRDKDGTDWMTSIKDQNPCGTCWVHGTLGSLEAAINIYHDDPDIDMDLSEQMILSRAPNITPTCSGGYPEDAYDYLVWDGGVPNEACFPYQCPACNPSPDPVEGCTIPVPCNCCPDWADKAWEITYAKVTPDTTGAYKEALLQYGPLGVPMRSPDDWFYYAGGIYQPVLESEEWAGAFPYGQANHWVTLVGYDDTGGYWIVKNSWSRDWGEEGYGKIFYGDIEQYGHTFAILSVDGPDNCKSVTVYNDGDADLEISDVTISYDTGEPTGWLDAERQSFTLTPPERAPGQLHIRDSEGITVWVDTSGLGAGEYHGTLNIISDDPDENPAPVTVTLRLAALPAPDLIISEKSEEWVDFGAKTYNITYTVKNQGGLAAGASTTGVYIDSGPWVYYSCPALDPSASDTKTVGPYTMSGDSDTIEVCADNEDVVSECDETNNCETNIIGLMEGDVNLDWHVTMVDALFIAQYRITGKTLTASQLKCADTTDEGTVDMIDALQIAQWRFDPDGSLGILFKPLWDEEKDADMLPPVP